MRNYRAVVVDGRKLIRYSITFLVAVFIVITLISNMQSGLKYNKEESAKQIITESIPVFSAVKDKKEEQQGTVKKLVRRLISGICTFDPYNPITILDTEIPLIHIAGNSYLAQSARGEAVEAYNPENADKGEGAPQPDMPSKDGQYPIKAVDSGQAKALGESNAKILIRNETTYSVDIENMLNSNLKFSMNGDGPKILILHTHATECYTDEGVNTYSPDEGDRTLDENKNVIAVGKRMKEIFEKNGLETIHDTTLHDHPNFNGSYANSLKTAEGYLAKYPSIKIVLDIHRDAYVYDDGSKAKFVTKINGKNAAQLMLVVGTNAGGLEHPEWKENMKLAIKLQQYISATYPTLMRGVNMRKERFNGHTTTGSLIIEVGSSGNTLDEALYGAECAAIRIADFLNKL